MLRPCRATPCMATRVINSIIPPREKLPSLRSSISIVKSPPLVPRHISHGSIPSRATPVLVPLLSCYTLLAESQCKSGSGGHAPRLTTFASISSHQQQSSININSRVRKACQRINGVLIEVAENTIYVLSVFCHRYIALDGTTINTINNRIPQQQHTAVPITALVCTWYKTLLPQGRLP